MSGRVGFTGTAEEFGRLLVDVAHRHSKFYGGPPAPIWEEMRPETRKLAVSVAHELLFGDEIPVEASLQALGPAGNDSDVNPFRVPRSESAR